MRVKSRDTYDIFILPEESDFRKSSEGLRKFRLGEEKEDARRGRVVCGIADEEIESVFLSASSLVSKNSFPFSPRDPFPSLSDFISGR